MQTSEKFRVRSPSFPFISLPEAVDRARVFHRNEKQHAAPPQVAVTYWGYSSLKSSGGPRTIAALRAYGLMEEENDHVRLADRALALLRDGAPAVERRQLLQEMALLPPTHRVVWDTFGSDLPSEATLGSFLVDKLGFNPDSVDGFLRTYRETIGFAELAAGAPPEVSAPPPPSPAPERPAPPAAPSDLTLRFPLLHGNQVELRVLRKIPPREAEQLRRLFDLWLEKITEA